MRGVIGRRLTNPNGFTFASILKQNPFLIQPTSHFSSSSSDGSGRGRGRGGGGFTDGDERGQFGINRNESVNQGRDSSESQSSGGYGHGRGRPIQSNPISPPFSSFVGSDSPSIGRGRGSVGSEPISPFAPQPPPPQSQSPPNVEEQSQTQTQTQTQSPPKTPVFTQLQEMKEATSTEAKSGEVAPPENIFNALGSEFSNPDQRIVPGNGAGRGKPFVESAQTQRPQPPPPQQQRSQPQQKPRKEETPRPQLSVEEAGRRARSELSRGEAAEGSSVRGRGGGGRGRGRGVRGRGRGGRGGDGYGNDKKEGEAEQEALSIFVGDSADGEKFAKNMGPEWMKELAQGFEDICDKALPSTTHDAIVDAYETNLMVKFTTLHSFSEFTRRKIV